MGTRGVLGVRINGVDKLTYNHNDSYPEHLGEMTCEALRRMGTDWLRQKAEALSEVSISAQPTQEDMRRLERYTDLTVSSQTKLDWYCLLRRTQGDIGAILDCGLFLDSSSHLLDSLFCEWAYIINLDSEKLEVYRGFQRKAHTLGRYADLRGDGRYFPCALVCEFPFNDLPVDFAKQVRAAVGEEKC